MKLIVCIFALLVATQAGPVHNDLGKAVHFMYDKVVSSYSCGIAGSGPLDPYILEKEYTEKPFEYEEDNFKFSIHMKHFEISGLKSLKLDSSVYDAEKKLFTMYIIPPHLHLKTNYSWSMDMKYQDSYKLFNVEDGFIDAHIKFPQEKYGFSFELVKDELTGNLTMKNMKFYEPVFDWVKEFKFLGEHYDEFAKEVKPIIEEMEADFDKMAIEQFEEKMNKIFINYKDVSEIVDEIYKAAGDESTGPFGDKLCVH